MAFFSRFFSRADQAPLPSLEELLRERDIPAELPGLADLAPDFELHDAEDRVAWVDALADLHQTGKPLPPLWLDAQYDLLPELVPTWMAERDGYHYKPFVDGLSQRIRVCGQPMPSAWLTLWSVAEADVMERALEQLREKSKGKPFKRLPSGIYQSTYADGLDASRLMLPELWRDLFPGQNTFVAVPNRNVMLVSPQVLLPKLVEAIDGALADASNRLFATIFQAVGGNLMPANLQDPHPIAPAQRELRQSDVLHAYAAQESSLDPNQGTIAPVGMLRTQQGRAISYTVWNEGQPVQLPETDMIIFVGAQKRPLGMYIRQTLPRISELKGVPVEIFGPRRVRYEGFPTTEQLARLECSATGEQVMEIFKNQQSGGGRPAPLSPKTARPPQPSGEASPVPPHLRGLNLGVQSKDE